MGKKWIDFLEGLSSDGQDICINNMKKKVMKYIESDRRGIQGVRDNSWKRTGAEL